MSEGMIIRRGGGASLKATDALLRVQAPAGSTVTITKGTTTKTDLGHENADDHTLYDYYFIIHQSQFDSVNPWTVTATLNGQTATATVVVNAADEYDVILSYTLYLVQSGVTKETIYNTSGTWTDTPASGYVNWTCGNVVCLRYFKVDVTKYSKLSMNIARDGNVSWRSSGTPYIGIGTSVPSIDGGSGALSNVPTKMSLQGATGNEYTAGIRTLDISGYTGECYICVTQSGYTGTNGQMYIGDYYLHN